MTVMQSGLRGWRTAYGVLEKTRSTERRDLLAGLLHDAGVEGTGLKYLAQVLRFKAGEGDFPTPPKGLSAFEIELIQTRAQELIEPLRGDPRLPRMRASR